jgi:hypothetical protein
MGAPVTPRLGNFLIREQGLATTTRHTLSHWNHSIILVNTELDPHCIGGHNHGRSNDTPHRCTTRHHHNHTTSTTTHTPRTDDLTPTQQLHRHSNPTRHHLIDTTKTQHHRCHHAHDYTNTRRWTTTDDGRRRFTVRVSVSSVSVPVSSSWSVMLAEVVRWLTKTSTVPVPRPGASAQGRSHEDRRPTKTATLIATAGPKLRWNAGQL